jgi:hypothetical protein
MRISDYFDAIRDKRAIVAVCEQLELLGLSLSVRGVINDGQYRKIRPSPVLKRLSELRASERLVSDERILDVYRWAQGYVREKKLRVDPEKLAALTIVCEEILGLSWTDATWAVSTTNPASRAWDVDAIDRIIERGGNKNTQT